MADSVALIAKMQVQLRDLEKGMAKAGQIADKGVRDIERRFSQANPKLPAAFSGALKGAFAGIAAVGFAELVKGGREAIAVLADMADEAQRIGTSTDFLQEFSYAVQMSGGTSEEASGALERFAKALSEAGTGGGNLGKIFEANGVSIRNSAGELISVQDALAKFANLIQNTATQQDKLNIAADVFGRGGGPAVVNALNDGADGLAEFARQAQETGGVLDATVIAKAAELDDKFTALEISAGNWAKSLAVSIAEFAIPQIEDLIKQINTVLNLLGTDVSKYFNDPKGSTANAMLKAGNGQKLGGADDLSSFYDAQGDNFDAARLKVPITKGHTILPKSGGGGGGRHSSAKAERDRGAEVIKELELELQKTTAVGDARDAILVKEKTLQELRHANVDAVSEEGKKISELVQAISDAAKEQEKIVQAMDDFRDVADAGLGSFVSDLLEGKSAAEALQDSLKNMLNTIAQIAERNLLEGLFGPSGSGGGGILSGILGSIVGKRAGGGSVAGGKPYLVGEKGPELMVPGRSGTVIPNGALGGGGGGNVSVIVNAPPGSKVQQRQERGPDFRKIIVDVVNEHASSGGLDGPMRGRYGARPAKVR